MAINWDFRTILNLHPESDSFTCVSTKSDNSARCHNRRPLLSDIDLAKASGILGAMDRCESLKASYGYLKELARLTLCIIHSEGKDQVELISAIWQSMIEKHMNTEIGTPVQPKTRRSIGRRRTSSITVMTVLKEDKAEQSPTPAKTTPTSRIPVPSPSRKDSVTSTRPRPTRNMSRKISSLISEVGFQAASNEQFVASIERPKSPTKAPLMPTAVPLIPPARKMPIRSKTKYPPAVGVSDEWSSYPLLSLLTRSSNILKSDDQLGEQMAQAIEAGVRASRRKSRRDTASSVGSSTTGSKTSSADSDSGSSAPSSRTPSVKSSPELKPTEESEIAPFPAFPLPPPMISSGSLYASPEQAALPTFDFRIFQSLPLPPGHKQSISNDKELIPLSNNKTLAEDTQVVKAPPRSFESDSSRPSFGLKGFEKLKPRKTSEASQPTHAVSKEAPATTESCGNNQISASEESIHERDSDGLIIRHLQGPTKSITLPESDTFSMISTSWLNSPRLSRTSSARSAGRLSRKLSQSRSPPVSPTVSLSRSASISGKLSRQSSFSLSRSLSRTLSRHSSTKTSPKVEEEPTTTTTTPHQRASSFSLRTAKEESISLPRLIQMSHELARRLEGYESHGHIEILPVTRYKYHLPSGSAPVPRSTSPVPEVRFSRLFMSEVSLNFPFSIPVQRKPGQLAKEEYDWVATGRSRSVGAGIETPRDVPKFVRPEMNLAAKLAPIPKTGPRETQVEIPPNLKLQVPPIPVAKVEGCAMCGNTQTIWGRCDCGIPVAAWGKVGEKGRTRTSIVGERPVMVGKMERRPTKRVSKRVPKRASTLRRIRNRFVRTFTI